MLGIICLGLIVGLLLSVAVLNLLTLGTDGWIFRYEGFDPPPGTVA